MKHSSIWKKETSMNENFEIPGDWKWREKLFEKSDRSIMLYYEPIAVAKIKMLLYTHDKEIGWNMVVKPFKAGYKIYDVVVYPQNPSPAFVGVDLPKYGLWKASLDDDVEANLFGHGHSHVNMGVMASSIDIEQQKQEIETKGKGFFLFQIYNKDLKCNSFLYDLNKGVYYPNEKIIHMTDFEGMDDFVKESFEMAKE